MDISSFTPKKTSKNTVLQMPLMPALMDIRHLPSSKHPPYLLPPAELTLG